MDGWVSEWSRKEVLGKYSRDQCRGEIEVGGRIEAPPKLQVQVEHDEMRLRS